MEWIEFSGATVPDKNGAGIRQEGVPLTVRHCRFHDNENCILAGDVLVLGNAIHHGPRTDITDLPGRVVRVIEDESRPQGPLVVVWDLRNTAGKPVAPGVYHVRMSVGVKTKVGRFPRPTFVL